ncbi:hypothetical protein JXQ70_04845 [bacterium]|nr:hypothetical protein [bacterium]
MAKDSNLETIASVKKKDNVEIKASLTSWRNDLYIDIREFILPDEDDEGGYSGPTKKGFRFHHEIWPDFKMMIEKIDQEMQKRLS